MRIVKLCAALLAAAAWPAAPAADKVAEIVFDREPQEKGLSFLREHCQAEEIEVKGQKVWTWKFWAGSFPKQLWVHDARFVFTDPAFKDGKMPVFNGEIEYVHYADPSVEIHCDNAGGVARIASCWGEARELRTLKFSSDDAFFGGRGTVESGGAFDLQARTYNTPLYIRRIRIVGADLDDAPDFGKLLRVADVSTPRRDIFVFGPGEGAPLVYTLANLAHKRFDGEVRFTLETHEGKVLQEVRQKVSVPGGGKAKATFAAATEKLPRAVYYTRAAFTRTGEDAPCLVREGSVLVGPKNLVRRAAPGEFLYGLDMCFGFHGDHPELLRWARYMGVNVLRYGIDRGGEEKYAADIANLKRKGFEVVANADGSKNPDRDRFLAEQDEVDAFVRRFAKRVRPAFWELGNEPDLPFFFGPGIPRYIEGFHRMYDAIKSGDPAAKVSNGGLANVPHIEESGKRTRQFFELIDPAKIDYVAYHAHGPRYGAESGAYRKMRALADEFGKGAKLKFSDTETGVMAPGRDPELLQASTCVEKFVFAQEVGLPYLLWFRLYFKGDEEQYGNLVTYREPRPVVLAYRTLTERLRDFAFERRLDAGEDGVKAFLFRAKDGRRTAVCWTDGKDGTDVSFGRAGGFASAKVYDIFGNESEAGVAEGRAAVRLTRVPQYLVWAGAADEKADVRIGK